MKPLHRMFLPLGLSAILVSFACERSQRAGDDPVADLVPAPSVPVARPNVVRMPKLPSEFTNLQALPADISKAELKRRMKLIAKSLGTKCDYCHREDGDFASDEIREKVVAREMMRMVERINQEYFLWEDAPEVTCFTCHHGHPKPQMEPGTSDSLSTETNRNPSKPKE